VVIHGNRPEPLRSGEEGRLLHSRLSHFLAFAIFGALMLGCGGSAQNPPPDSSVPTIVTQPQDATVPMGLTATFSVYAVGSSQLAYQWSRNGSVIEGATGSSYTTPPVAFGDTGAKFSVVVKAGGGSVTSSAAALTVGPRSPAAGDLRFQQVGSPATAGGYAGESALYLEYPFGNTYSSTYGSPLRMGSGLCVLGVAQDCAWFYYFVPVPSGVSLSTGYLADVLEKLDADLGSHTDASSVVVSLDTEADDDVFGMAWRKADASGFDYKHDVVPLSGLQTLVANYGANSRVVTAIAFDASGQASLLSYGWASDTKTVYDTATATMSFDQIPAQATSLANSGYVITAFGGDPTYGYIMVGTRVHGDSLPRPILTFPPSPSGTPINNYALVALAGDLGDGGSNTVVWIYEK
jgi:hypothetical protein